MKNVHIKIPIRPLQLLEARKYFLGHFICEYFRLPARLYQALKNLELTALSGPQDLGPISIVLDRLSGAQLFITQLSSAKLPQNLLNQVLLFKVDYWTEEHVRYDYMQQMNATMPRLNSTLIGVTAVRRHHVYSFYYQNLTRWQFRWKETKDPPTRAIHGLLPMLLKKITLGLLFLVSSQCFFSSFSTWECSRQSRQVTLSNLPDNMSHLLFVEANNKWYSKSQSFWSFMFAAMLFFNLDFGYRSLFQTPPVMQVMQYTMATRFYFHLFTCFHSCFHFFTGTKVNMPRRKLRAHPPPRRTCLPPLPVPQTLPQLLGALLGPRVWTTCVV